MPGRLRRNPQSQAERRNSAASARRAAKKLTVAAFDGTPATGGAAALIWVVGVVVVEQGRDSLNSEVELTVTKLLQTSAGRMIFGRLGGESSTPSQRPATGA